MMNVLELEGEREVGEEEELVDKEEEAVIEEQADI